MYKIHYHTYTKKNFLSNLIVWILFCTVIFFFNSCKEKVETNVIEKEGLKVNTDNLVTKDSIELTELIRAVYKWHNTNELDDFPYKYNEKQDSIFVGIDWDVYETNSKLFQESNFFSEYFLKEHKSIAKTLDASIKKADISWRNSNDGISLWETGANNWCGCQDNPDKYWELLFVDSLVVSEEKADFIWSWDNDYSHTYRVKAIKDQGKWKINYLDGFKYFYTVEEYDKMMKVEKKK